MFDFFSKSVDIILGDFNKILSRLEDAVAHHQTKATEKSIAAEDLRQASIGHATEANRASIVIDKIKALIN